MPARADLLAIADACAAHARELVVEEAPVESRLRLSERWTANAKEALEAAGMAATTRDDFEQALDDALPRLERIGVIDAEQAKGLAPQQFVEGIVRSLEWLSAGHEGSVRLEHAYSTLRALTDGLQRDFERAETPTAARIAQRIASVHDSIDAGLA